MKIFLAMTTIPDRFHSSIFKDQIHHLYQQTIPFEKLFLSIPIRYKRFPEIPKLDTQDLEKKYSTLNIIWLEQDYGPSCKFLGPLIFRFKDIQNSILIIIDDDRYYNIQMNQIYSSFFENRQYHDIQIVSGNAEFYNQQFFYEKTPPTFLDIRTSNSKYISGFMSFAFCLRNPPLFHKLTSYTQLILSDIPLAFYHDEGILLNFLWFEDIPVYYINYKFINIMVSKFN